jgi:amino acid permease
MASSLDGSGDPKSSSIMKSDFLSHPVNDVDVEMGSNNDSPEELKRNMKGRHINMIAIAGMIVSY